MDGFSSHTYMWVNAGGERFWVKYHFKTEQGVENFTDFLPSELDDIERLVGNGGLVQRFPPIPEQELKLRK